MKLFLFCLTLVMFFIGSVSAFMAPRAEGVLTGRNTMRTSSTLNWFWDRAARMGLVSPRTQAAPVPVLPLPLAVTGPALVPQAPLQQTGLTPHVLAPPAERTGDHLHSAWFWAFEDTPWAPRGKGYGIELFLVEEYF